MKCKSFPLLASSNNLRWIHIRVTCGVARSKECLVGKTAIVTGGNSGIGYQVALALATRGCRVIIADKADASQSRDNIISETNNSNIVTKHLDLASFKSVRSFAKEIKETEPKIDILVNNAGIAICPVSFTEDGIQHTWQINHYGPFLLTHLLMDVLKQSAPSRIIFTSSGLSYFTAMDEKDLENTKDSYSEVSVAASYQNTKLCNVMCSRIFAKKLANTGVTCNALHPGLVSTSIFSANHNNVTMKFPVLISALGILAKIVGKTAEEGAQTTIHLAVANEVCDVSGKMFSNCRPTFMPPQANNLELCENVWKRSERVCDLKEFERLVN